MNNLKKRRLELGLTQPQVSDFLKMVDSRMDVGMVSRFENGVCIPTPLVSEAINFLFENPSLSIDKVSHGHGGCGTRLYIVWQSMKQRCNDPNCKSFPNYGGRGISVCPEWEDSFPTFRDWSMSHGYSDELTIDRKNVNQGYSPENCRWATMKEQANNTRRNRRVLYNGISHTVTEWSDSTGIASSCLRARLDRGWNAEKALTTLSRSFSPSKPETALQATAAELFSGEDLQAIGELAALPTTDEYSPEVKRLLTHLYHDKKAGMSRTELCAALNMPDRQVRELIEQARREGAIIINDQSGAGYFLSDDPDVWARQYQQDTSRALAILSRRKALRAQLKAAGREV